MKEGKATGFVAVRFRIIGNSLDLLAGNGI